MVILPLDQRHDKRSFDCGVDALNKWLQQTAGQHKEKGVSSTFVTVVDANATEILGFYTLSISEIINTDLPATIGKRLPIKVPIYRLGRLATSVHHQRNGIGQLMLADAYLRVKRINEEVGGIGLMVNAKPGAVDFYRQYGFEPMLDHPLNLFLPISTGVK